MMKKKVFVIVIIAIFFTSHGFKTNDNRARDLQHFKTNYYKENQLVKLHKRHKHRKKRLTRCKRYTQYYRASNYQPNAFQIDPNVIPSQYVLPRYYVPTRCSTYCHPCPSSSCRRRCPNQDIFYPSVQPIRPTWRPYTTKTTRRPTTRTPRPKPKGTTKSTAFWTNTSHSNIIFKIPCQCDPDGSLFLTCNQPNGTCFCKPHFIGFNCNICEDGYWKTNKSCEECKCDKHGTLPNTICDRESGKCKCKQGVTGQHCTNCLPDYYGSVQTSCKKCDLCDKKGHVCNPLNGKCVCPPLTGGKDCENCIENSWGYEPGKGCEHCNCSTTGSSTQQCDQTRGICSCNVGFEGEKCSKCSFGYYGYPNCKKCTCDSTGTDEEHCQHGLCKCDNTGSCKCKENVQGRHCDRCKEHYYGLSKENINGCTECFCFGRSNICQDAQFHWDKATRLERNIEEDNQVTEDELSLSNTFLGDLTSSYGGYLEVTAAGGFFDVFLEGNNVKLSSVNNHNELRITESRNWRVSSRNLDFPVNCIDDLTRSCFMVVLQNVTSFIIKANNRIKEILLDKAKNEISAYPLTHSVEKCECPSQYSGLSCEDPNRGYYRYFSEDSNLSWIDRVIGIAQKCECNGHSNDCDSETGHCKNCARHTTGEHCEKCDDGYYLDKEEQCRACLCPSADQNNAKKCTPTAEDDFICQCQIGYAGNHCEKCDEKYYSPPNTKLCVPCDCNQYGIIPGDTGICDGKGKCRCQEGFTGDKCNQCVKEREYIENGVCKSCDECTMILFDEIDRMKEDIDKIYDMFKNGVGPPWKKLTDNLNKYNMLSEKYKTKKQVFEALLEGNEIEQLEVKVDKLEQRMVNIEELLETNMINADKLTDNSTILLKEANDLNKKLISMVESLENFGTKHINLKEALTKARQILKQIQNASKAINNLNNKEIFEYCSAINKRVDSIYGQPPSLPSTNIMEIKRKLDGLVDLVGYVENVIRLADSKNTVNSQKLELVKEKIEILKSKNKQLDTSLGDIINKLNATEDVFKSLETVYQDLIDISDFKEYEDLDNRVKRQMEQIPDVKILYDKAVEHVQELENKVENYHSLFNFTKDEWKKINASGAYEAIISGISETRQSLDHAQDTIKKAQILIMPEGGDNLDTKSNLAQTYSDRLKQRINNLKNLSNNLNEKKRNIDQLKYSILENGKSNNDVSQNLLKTNNNITSQAEKVAKVEKAIKSASEVSDRMRDIYKKVDEMAFDKQFNFDKKFQKYQEQVNPKEIKHLNADLKSAQEALKSLHISQPSDNKNKNSKTPVNRLSNLEKKTKELQNLINLAKQQVDGVDVALNLKNCHMIYKVLKSQYFQSLEITFNCENCMLFNWTKTTEEYLSVRVKKGEILVHVEGNDISIQKSVSGENTLFIQKTGPILKLQFGVNEKIKQINGMNFISRDDSIEVGSPKKSTKEIDTAYVYKIMLNGENFGLWNFANSTGNCIGQKRNASVDDNLNSLFNGKGYFEYGINTNLDPKQFSIRFEFSTFDENSTIYVAAHFATCSYVNLYLENGYVNFFIQLTNKENTTLKCSTKVNDGKSHLAEISWKIEKSRKLFITHTLAVDNKLGSTPKKQITPSNVFKLRETKHYLGGVPPTFNRNCIPIQKQSLLGFLELKSQLNNASISYGIIKTKALTFIHAWINQNGYLQLEHPKEALNSIIFILRPTVTYGIVIKLNDDQSIRLEDSNIVIDGVRYNNSNINLHDYNTVELKLDQTNEIIINGISQTLLKKPDIMIKDLQIGEIDGKFAGGIRDIMINNRIIHFDNSTVKTFQNIEIGREKPLLESNINVKSLSMSNLTNTMQNTERCTEFDNNDIEQGAVKFGDKPNSYTHIITKFWRSNFSLQFDFRTYYPNGVLFVSINKRRNYIVLELKEGQLQLSIEGRKKKVKTLPISPERKMNDGNWHNIRLTRKLKKLTVIVDKETKPSRINMRIKPKDEIYFGGVASNSDYASILDLRSHLLPFRGCMRALEINNEQQFLINNKNVQHSNITLCFSKVEEGAYFGGDAYAIYKDDFQISEMLELSFEFRTSEQNGILLSVSNHGDYPALSVELQNGAIVMAVNLGNGVISNVTNNLYSDIALCNNKWHNVTAMYSSSELTVNVDGIRKSWVQSDVNSTMDEMEAPMYVGGLPDNAPVGTLKTLTNFKGCIRRLKIENQLMDWSDMNELNNVLLNSCPISDLLENS